MKLAHTNRILGAAILSSVMLLASAPKGHSTLTYYVTLNVASLNGNGNGPFSLDLALSDGSQNGETDNTVTLSNFSFQGGGGLGAVEYSSGGETGSMSSTVTLTNSHEDNELAQQIIGNPTSITFKVSETLNTDNPYMDQFDVAILDSGLNNIPTNDPGLGNTLVLQNIATTDTLSSVNAYQSTSDGEAPGVTASVVPEPSTTAGILGGMAILLGFRKFRRNKQG